MDIVQATEADNIEKIEESQCNIDSNRVIILDSMGVVHKLKKDVSSENAMALFTERKNKRKENRC